MIVVNSVRECAAGKARPGVSLFLRYPVRPNRVTIAEILTDAYEQFCQPIATPGGADFTIAAPPS
jgi:hypothetical protein